MYSAKVREMYCKKAVAAKYNTTENGIWAKNGIRMRISTSLNLFIGFSKISEAYVRKIKCRHKIPHGRNKTVIYGWNRGCLKCMPYAFTKNDSTYGPNVKQNIWTRFKQIRLKISSLSLLHFMILTKLCPVQVKKFLLFNITRCCYCKLL
jgi:hypothetical protein